MGLGPPVCTKCERIIDLMTDTERDERIASGQLKPTSYYWWCSKCGGQIWTDDRFFTQTDPQLAKSLWELPPDDQERYRQNNIAERKVSTDVDLN